MDQSTPPAVTREQLIYALTEAAEIEHGLMCCYLYAAWSLKRADEGLTETQALAAARWRGLITGVAVEEMTHLAVVSNLLTALGARPHLTRPNLPVSKGYHPSDIVVELAPFGPETIEHFLFLERPDDVPLSDASGFATDEATPRLPGAVAEAVGLTPGAHDYATVGELYRGVAAGLVSLVERLGEAAVFVGDPARQAGGETAPLPGLRPIVDLASALAALEVVVTQGEGASADHAEGHFARFKAVRDELAAATAQDPAFAPAWPAARNPVLRAPPNPTGKVRLTAVEALRVADLAAAVYGVMLRALQLVWATPGAEPRRALFGAADAAMGALGVLGEALARLPACDDGRQGVNAGFPFTCPRSLALDLDAGAGAGVLAERLRELVPTLDAETARLPGLVGPVRALARLAETLAPASAPRKPAAAPAPALALADATAPVPPISPVPPPPDEPPVADPVEVATGRDLDILFHGKRCIHHRRCVLGAPQTFLANTPGEWIFPDRTPTEALVGVAHECPSGAIRYRRRDGGAEEAAPPVNTVRLRENGPYAVHAALAVHGDPEPGFRATLCRCGASKNKPWCDGSHVEAGFQATGEPATIAADPLAARDGPLTVTPLLDGPLQIEGAVEICAGTGRIVLRAVKARLCRCGRSAAKPLCDGTHRVAGFRAPGV